MNERYHMWKSENLQLIDVVSYKTLPIAEQLDEALQRDYIRLIPQHCFHNAFQVVTNIPGVTYCEGYVQHIAPLHHAWNCYDGKYFDLTLSEELVYFQKIEMERKELISFMREYEISGPFLLPYFYKHVMNMVDFRTLEQRRRSVQVFED